MGVMVNGAGNSQPNGTWPEVRSGPLIVGGSLIGIGVAVAAVGLAVAGSDPGVAEQPGNPAQPVRAAEVGAGQDGGRVGGAHLAGASQRQGTPDAARAIGELTNARG